MSTPNSANVYTQGFGSKPIVGAIVSTVAPGTTFSPAWHLGQEWINTSANAIYILTSISTSGGVTTPTWTLLEAASGAINSVTGTANQVTASTTSGAVTLSTPSTFIAPGSIASTTGITVGTKLSVTTGANASVGTSAAMTSGAVTVANTSVTASSLIFVIPAALGTVTSPQAAYISAKSAGVSFTITSASATDTSTWNYWIIN